MIDNLKQEISNILLFSYGIILLPLFLTGCPPNNSSSYSKPLSRSPDFSAITSKEFIDCGDNSFFGRIQTPQGWIVTFSNAAFYVPDSEHRWLVNEPEKR